MTESRQVRRARERAEAKQRFDVLVVPNEHYAMIGMTFLPPPSARVVSGGFHYLIYCISDTTTLPSRIYRDPIDGTTLVEHHSFVGEIATRQWIDADIELRTMTEPAS